MARPLREQFFLATVALLVPVSAVMTWAAGTTYTEQLVQLRSEAGVLAATVAAHLVQAGPEQDAGLAAFLAAIPLETGIVVTVTDASGRVVAHQGTAAGDEVEMASTSVAVTGRPLTVSVGLPTAVAWWRAGPIYRRTIAITGIATLILFGLEALFVRRWLRAFTSLGRLADRVGEGDLRTPPVEPMPSQELEHLSAAFRSMVDRLRAAHENIARQVEEERRTRQELELLQQQVIRQERLAAIGVLLSGIAHELNNPLQAISGFAQLLQRDPRIAEDARADLALIQKESARASGIIRNLSRFSRQQDSRPVPVYFRDVVQSVVELRQRRLQEVGVVLDVVDDAVEPVLAVLTELQQVVLNFVINAEQAMAAAGTPDRWIGIRTKDVGGMVRLEVEDNGPGVPAEHESKLFQPFFTTKPPGEGTGLGLSVSYGIIQGCRGTIGYRRGARGGAEFFFELPVAAAAAGRTGTIPT